MQRVLTCSVLMLFTIAACGADESDDDSSSPTDAATSRDSARADGGGGGATPETGVVSRGVQVENVGAACKTVAECKGSGSLTCASELLGSPWPNGYCTAACNTDDECGANGACPIAQLTSAPGIGELIRPFVSQLLPMNCLQKCDKSKPSPCRDGYTCAGLLDLAGDLGAGAGSLPIPGLDAITAQTYCAPPVTVSLGDGGISLPGSAQSDAGAGSSDAAVGGLDAGPGDGGT